MAELNYVAGDATLPVGDGERWIVHVVNDVGLFGRGFAGAVARRWPDAAAAYRQWHARRGTPFGLGRVLLVPVGHGVSVAHLVGQHGVRSARNPTPVRYDAIRDGLHIVAEYAAGRASVHMPRIGCGLAGGAWDEVEPIVRKMLVERDVDVTVYDLPGAHHG